MVAEPGFAEAARALGFDDAVTVGVQLDIIANAAAKGARGVLDDLQAHYMCPLFNRD
jgi:hypothetical protein